MTLPSWLDEPERKPDPTDSRYAPVVFIRGSERVRAEDLTDKELGQYCARLAYNQTAVGVAMFTACIAEVKRRGLL